MLRSQSHWESPPLLTGFSVSLESCRGAWASLAFRSSAIRLSCVLLWLHKVFASLLTTLTAGSAALWRMSHIVHHPHEGLLRVQVFAGECLRDLLDTSAKLLRLGGRLVYFLPAAPEVYREEEIPQHPALRLIANSEQILSTKFSRRLITMEKVGYMMCCAAS